MCVCVKDGERERKIVGGKTCGERGGEGIPLHASEHGYSSTPNVACNRQ